jgi:hypothetical protein
MVARLGGWDMREAWRVRSPLVGLGSDFLGCRDPRLGSSMTRVRVTMTGVMMERTCCVFGDSGDGDCVFQKLMRGTLV